MSKRIVLCADDYGQAPAISQGIRSLIQNGRLSATSCLVNSPFWLEHAKWLHPFKSRIDIGLHFNLTEGKALSRQFIDTYGENLFPLSILMRKAFMRTVDSAVLEAELQAQLDTFISATDFSPTFIDGHQHAHQLPVVRDALINVYEKRLRKQKTYVRLVDVIIKASDFDMKKIIIYLTGTNALKRLLKQHHIPHNPSFSGCYSFSKAHRYGSLFPRFLQESSDGGLIMCHPAFATSENEDPIAAARFKEYQYLFSNQFLIDCHEQGVKLARFVNGQDGQH
jgi:chitin disaccharide deacetylase